MPKFKTIYDDGFNYLVVSQSPHGGYKLTQGSRGKRQEVYLSQKDWKKVINGIKEFNLEIND